MSGEGNGVDRYNPERAGPEQYAPRRRRLNNVVEVPRKTLAGELNAFEAEIHQLVRGATPQAPHRRAEANASDRQPTKNIDALIGHAVGKRLEEIDRLIVELQSIRKLVREEGERLSREIASYTSLNDTVKTAMMTISENLGRWRSSARPVTGLNDPAA
jgi:hypothetical protein